MLGMILRILVVALWGWGLWVLWRSLRSDRTAMTVVGLGFAARALAGVALFWVSYLSLPVAPSLHQGLGFWFFALDAQMYFGYADNAVEGGLAGIWGLNPTLPNVFYIKILALTLFAVGRAVSAALVLNLTAFLVTCLAVWRIAQWTGAAREATYLALAAVSFAPSWILWTTQPLKDTLFLALVAAYVVPLVWFAGAVRAGGWSWRTLLLGFGGQWAMLYAIAGIRWYFALMVVTATLIAWTLAVWRAPARRLASAVALVVLYVLLIQAIPLGAGPYLPAWAHDALRPWSAERGLASIVAVPSQVAEVVNDSRAGLLAAGGATEIRLSAAPDSSASPALPSPSPPDPPPLDAPVRPAAPVPPVRPPPPSEFEPPLQPEPSSEARLPATTFEKMFVGMVAMFIPRVIAQSAGWVQIGGGRGLWAFADVDTVVFSLTLVVGIVLTLIQVRRGFRPHPVFWGVAVLLLLIALPLAYEGGNFGTMFRQRNMVMLEFLLLPVLMEPRRPSATRGSA